MSAQPTDRAASFVFVPEWYEALSNSSGSCPWCGAMQHWGHDDACGRAIVIAALADRNRLRAIEAAARAYLAHDGSGLGLDADNPWQGDWDGPANFVNLRALRAALARPAEEERG